MGWMDTALSFADGFMDNCAVCSESTNNTDENSGLNVCKKCAPELEDVLAKTGRVHISTLSPNGSFEQISPIMVIGTSKAYNLAFDSATFKLKKNALALGATSVVGVQYQFRSSLNAAKNRVCEIMAFGTAIKS